MAFVLVGKKQLAKNPGWADRIGKAISGAYAGKESFPALQVREKIGIGASYFVHVEENGKVLGYVLARLPDSKNGFVEATEIAVVAEARSAGEFLKLKRRFEGFVRKAGFAGAEYRYANHRIARIYERKANRPVKSGGERIEVSMEAFLGDLGAKKIRIEFPRRQPRKRMP